MREIKFRFREGFYLACGNDIEYVSGADLIISELVR